MTQLSSYRETDKEKETEDRDLNAAMVGAHERGLGHHYPLKDRQRKRQIEERTDRQRERDRDLNAAIVGVHKRRPGHNYPFKDRQRERNR